MISINNFTEDIEHIVTLINNTFNIDVAIFNTDCNIIASTKKYLQNKGNAVHAPSLLEVMEEGRILVNNPGKMPSCIGCRFKDNCPSTIELLNCLKADNETIGVIAFTSFTTEGHDEILNNIKKYTSLIDTFSVLISKTIYYKNKSMHLDSYINAVISAFELIDDGLIVADSNGDISIINNYALELFSSCNLHTKSLYQLFNKNILPAVLSGHNISNLSTKINSTKIKISSMPIFENNENIGTVIRISNKSINVPNKDTSFSKDNKPFSLNSIIGNGKQIQNIKNKIVKIQNSPSTILITGETGTGKGLLAKAIHNESSRKNKPFITVNCTSIPENLFESELFGYETGAFTGAKKEGKPGKFELANEGTLFLDEIGEMPLNLQSKLLSVLQDSTFERVGGITPINVDVRIIAATNKNLIKLIEAKQFRSDLYYRLNVIPIEIPALRERRDDIVDIANNFLSMYSKKLNRNVNAFEDEVLEIFIRHNWPGNIRQLENTIEYAVNIADSDIISFNDLPEDLLASIESNESNGNKVKENEYNLIIETVNKYGWDVNGKTLAAKELGIGIRTLYRKLNNK